MDSPDRSAAQVLAFMHGPEGEPQNTKTEPSEPIQRRGDGNTSTEYGALPTMQDNNERYGVVKIVWTAEEDQQLLQVRPRVQPALVERFNRTVHTFTLAQRTERASTPLTRARIAHLVAVGARARPAPLVGDCRAASRSGGQAVPRTVPALAV